MAVDPGGAGSVLPRSSPLLSTEEESNHHHAVFSGFARPINKNFSSCSSSSDFGSSFGSPVGSELDSTESESDQDDDYIAELSRQMAHYMLQDDDNTTHDKTGSLAGKPRPRLWSELVSGEIKEEAPTAGKFEKLKRDEEMNKSDHTDRYSTKSSKPCSVLSNLKYPNSSSVDYQSKQSLIDEQIRAIQMIKVKQQEVLKQKQESFLNRGKQDNGYMQIERKRQQGRQFLQSKGTERASSTGYSSSGDAAQKVKWGNLQQQQLQQQRTDGSEMRAYFLGSNTGTCGTGVFLPRGVGSNTSESRKKSGCSTVRIPARVVQALKLHFDKMGDASGSNLASFPLQHDALSGDVSFSLQLQQKSHSGVVSAKNHDHNHHQDISLPQEWTY